MMYRVRAVAPDKYIVEKRGWFFWHYAICNNPIDWDCDDIPTKFSTPREAQDKVHELNEEKAKVRAHCAQEPWYFTA